MNQQKCLFEIFFLSPFLQKQNAPNQPKMQNSGSKPQVNRRGPIASSAIVEAFQLFAPQYVQPITQYLNHLTQQHLLTPIANEKFWDGIRERSSKEVLNFIIIFLKATHSAETTKRHNIRQAIRTAASGPNSTNPFECRICFTGAPDYAFAPCGHRCVCASCASKFKACPICRQPITQSLRIIDC